MKKTYTNFLVVCVMIELNKPLQAKSMSSNSSFSSSIGRRIPCTGVTTIYLQKRSIAVAICLSHWWVVVIDAPVIWDDGLRVRRWRNIRTSTIPYFYMPILLFSPRLGYCKLRSDCQFRTTEVLGLRAFWKESLLMNQRIAADATK